MSNLRMTLTTTEIWKRFIDVYSAKTDDLILLLKTQIDNCLDSKKVSILQNTLREKESEKDNVLFLSKFFEIVTKKSKMIFSKQLKRNPSIFIDDRDFLNSLVSKKDTGDLPVFIDCDWDWACYDHHWLNFANHEVSVTKILELIDANQSKNKALWLSVLEKLYADSRVPQRHNKFMLRKNKTKIKEYINDFIPLTAWYLDTDAVLSHFSLLFPKMALKHRKLLEEAALSWDLNLDVSEKAVNLNKLIIGLSLYKGQLKKIYSVFLDDELIHLSADERKVKKKQMLANFDVIFWNAIVMLVKEMINYLDQNKNIDDGLLLLFSNAIRMYSNIVDDKVVLLWDMYKNFADYYEIKNSSPEQNKGKESEKIIELQKKWLLELNIVDNIACFSLNKTISISMLWIPPDAFYRFLKNLDNVNYSKLNYCIIVCNKTSWDKNSKEVQKTISISNIPHSKADLKTFSLNWQLQKLNQLEENTLIELEKSISSRIEYLESLVTTDNDPKVFMTTDNGQQKYRISKSEIHNYWQINKKYLKELKELVQKREKLLKSIDDCRMTWLFHWRNWLAFISTSYSSIDDVVKILLEPDV